jgi:hypothetical protein
MSEFRQLFELLLLPVPVALVTWTITREEVFREFRNYCTVRSQNGRYLLGRKLFYMLTCEYCLSHWIALAFEILVGFRLLFEDWRGYVVGYAVLVCVANVYMSLYQRLRVDIRKDRVVADSAETELRKRRSA